MNTAVERVEDRLADFTRDKRVLVLSLMAIIIGVSRKNTIGNRVGWLDWPGRVQLPLTYEAVSRSGIVSSAA